MRSDAVFEHPELRHVLLPLMRADCEVNDTYAYREGSRLRRPISAFGGRDDGAVTRPKLERWAEVMTGGFRMEMLLGGHFSILREDRGPCFAASRASSRV